MTDKAADTDLETRDRASDKLLALATAGPDEATSLGAVRALTDPRRLGMIARSEAPDAIRAEALARTLNDRERLAQVRVRQAQGLWNLWSGPGNLEDAIERAREAGALAAPDDLRTRSYARFLVGAASLAGGRFHHAIQGSKFTDDDSHLRAPLLLKQSSDI